jgi:NAD(P)H-nitrite reductase large subunit
MKKIVIIGNGISGITAARHLRKRSDHNICIVSSETEHFFSRTALMYVYMGHLKYENIKPYEDWFWKKNRLDLVFGHVEKIETSEKTLLLKSGKKLPYDILIIASGSRSNKMGWPGENAQGVQTLYGYQDLQNMKERTRGIDHAVVVGGGLIGIEMVEMLRSRKIDVTMLVREPEFWSNVLPLQEANMISRHIRSHHVNLKLNTELKEIVTDEHGYVKSIITKQHEIIPCQFAGLTIGVSPNIAFLQGSEIKTNHGVLVNEYCQTNIPDVYAIGDCAERTYELPGRKNIEQVWYTGRMMGEVVAQTICNDPTKYEPGPWFNSAKFFDIEFQTYGNVDRELERDKSDFYWEHINGNKAIHVTWQKDTREFTGINAFGIRYRHELFDQWLRQKRSVDFVMQNLHLANFDPEFTEKHETGIVNKFTKMFSGEDSLITT